MPITTITQDTDNLTLTIVADFAAPVRRLWDAYADPRQIERFWGPPGWPATFTRHDMATGGESHYFMRGPDGEPSHGYWKFDQVWAAHHDPELIKRWMLGPEGWTMPVCEVATEIGGTYRNEWVDARGENRFGFTGELVESEPPVREVTTERMIGTDGPTTTNEMTLTPLEQGTLFSLVITYPDAATREMILATGMTDGMESSFARLESTVLVA